MHNKKRSIARSVAWVTALWLVLLIQPAQAQTFQVIHKFIGGDGASPYAGLTSDAAGRLYGTTNRGGTSDHGTVFRLTHSTSGWVLTPLYNFTGGSDGAYPRARVIFGPDGSLYGTTFSGGGSGFACDSSGCGTVFSLKPPSTACKAALCPWSKTTIQAFDGNGGDQPLGDLTFDLAGNLYGTTVTGGFYRNSGIAYQLVPSQGGWTENVLYEFPNYDLHNPLAGVVLDKAGNLYGTVESGGELGYGGVFQLTPSGAGWTENTLYVFQAGVDGANPYAGLIFDDAGNLYGATTWKGKGGGGTVFKLTSLSGGWGFSTLYGLVGSPLNGPQANPALDGSGNLYGTTFGNGAYGMGSVFKLTPGPGGWVYTSLHDFTGGDDGSNPLSNVIFDASGNLYGTASAGARKYQCPSNNGCGVVWEITP